MATQWYKHRGKNRVRRRRLRVLFRGASVLGVAAVCAVLAFVFSRPAWRMLDSSKLTKTEQSLIVYDKYGAEVSCLYVTENRINIAVETLPVHVIGAFVSAEDARFFEHPGFDLIRIFGAAWKDLQTVSYSEGASTMTQQLIKLTHLNNDKNMTRKIDEAILAYQLEKQFDKNEVLELYLNYVYFGGGCYGVEAAARTYFGVHAQDLSVSQAALLAGVLKSPARFAPHLRPEASVGRRNVILGLMESYGYISAETCKIARAEPLILNSEPTNNVRGYYVDLALTTSCELLGVDMQTLLSGGYRIQTEMEPELQRIGEAIFADDSYFPQMNGESAEGALVLVNAKDGGVAAVLGGRENRVALSFNRAMRIRRPPGSAIKPVLVYAPALLSGYTAASMLLDEQVSYDDYTPRNANNRYSGWVTMREAVTRSLNTTAVAVFAELGVQNCKRFASSIGIPFDRLDTRLGLALGSFTYGVSPYQLAGAYASFASGGIYRKPCVVSRITGPGGEALYADERLSSRVMDEGSAFILTSMLQSVVATGTAQRLAALEMDLAAKTGTVGDTESNRDIWLAAYNPEYAAVVWMGYDDSRGGRGLPPDTGGGSYPAEVLRTLFEQIYAYKAPPKFTVPPSVHRVRLDAYTLRNSYESVLASMWTPDDSAVYEYFVHGTEPTRESEFWQIPLPPQNLSVQLTGSRVEIRFTPLSRHVEYYIYRQNSMGFSVLVTTVTGTTEPQSITDNIGTMTGEFSYYIVPMHPLIQENGMPLLGEPSQSVTVWATPPG
ncbi:MAG: transglycosylase domain-containing protein [Clostridiales bacterium]|nr:transglycosylase domain-containing protein [Clostridiales bacterium]